jgi:HAMP domain-containing protein
MQSKLALLWLAAAISVSGQTPGDREFRRAQSNIEELRKQVDAGVAPRVKLEQAEEALSDAQDAELLSRTLYGKDLTEEQSAEMEAAALRRLERRQAALEKLQVLVDAGALSLRSLESAQEEVSWARKEHELVATRAGLIREIAEMARVEQQALEAQENLEKAPGGPVMERFDGDGSFTRDDFKRVLLAFEKQFGKPLPISAQGETAVHRALGFDHRDRVDVAIFPDTAEGLWLRRYLESNDKPYYAFRSSVPGKATGAHIHMGPPSNRLLKTD